MKKEKRTNNILKTENSLHILAEEMKAIRELKVVEIKNKARYTEIDTAKDLCLTFILGIVVGCMLFLLGTELLK